MASIKICLVIVYFGKWPNYINFFLKTCKSNPSVDFMFFSDNKSIEYDADNVRLIPFNLQDFNALATEKLKLKIHVTRAYKLCDFKPLYGAIFNDYLTRYDFWGHCDIDIILGNIRGFITNKILEENDIISARKEFLAGHFSLFRNTEKINELFRKSVDYERVFKDPELYYSFDECGGLWWELLRGESIWDCETSLDSMTHIIKKFEKVGYITSYFNTFVIEQDKHKNKRNLELEEFDEEVLWDNGKLTLMSTKKEFMYFHFHNLKNIKNFRIPLNIKIPDKFYVNKKGFVVDAIKKFLKLLYCVSFKKVAR